MKKVLSIFIAIFIAISLTGCKNEDKKTILNKASKNVNNVNGYMLQAEMELINNEDSYKYDVTVSFKKKDNYRVSLRNKTNNHEQIILRNEDGVYVLTPTLNKSFKFQSKWPYNNSQSYLLQSILNDIKNDANYSMKKKGNYYVFTSKVNYKNNLKLTHQDVYIDKNYNIKKVVVLDDDNKPMIKVEFKSIDIKAKFDDDYFELEENMQTGLSDDISLEVSKLTEPIYPMYLPEGTYLENEKVVDLDDGERLILTFSGEKPFMLVEQTISKEDEMMVIPTSGDLDIFMDTIAIIDESSITWTSDGVEYYLVSSVLDKTELLNVAKSISNMPLSK